MKPKPEVSVLMYCQRITSYTTKCLHSIFAQSLTNFELLVIIGPNAENNVRSLYEIKDSRLYIVNNESYNDMYEAFSIFASTTRSQYICFSQGSEIWAPDRLEKQYFYMKKRPAIGLTGGRIEFDDNLIFPAIVPTNTKIALFQNNPFVLSTLMVRKVIFQRNNLNFKDKSGQNSFSALIVKASQFSKLSILGDILVYGKVAARKALLSTDERTSRALRQIRAYQLSALYSHYTRKELLVHNKLLDNENLNYTELEFACSWLNKILRLNSEKKTYAQLPLKNLFAQLLSHQLSKYQSDRTSITRFQLINFLIEKFHYNTYLEIGVFEPGQNFDLINCLQKTGVDPEPRRSDIVGCTSDDFFKTLSKDYKFDLVFIDGLHHADQVKRDISNAIAHLNENGTVVCHDMLPTTEEMQLVPRQSTAWTGDCWKAWAYFRMRHNNLKMIVVDSDCGLGVIRRGQQKLYRPYEEATHLEYNFFKKHKKVLMNIISVPEFHHRAERDRL